MAGSFAQGGEPALQGRRVERGERAGAGAAGQDVEPARPVAGNALAERRPTAQQGRDIALGGQAELDVHVRQAKIAVEQQHTVSLARERVGKRDGKPSLADTSLARGDGDQAASVRRCSGHGLGPTGLGCEALTRR